MNWVVFGVLLGLAVFNLLGVGIWHYEWRNDHKEAPQQWKKDKHFWTWTIYLLLVGIAYVVLRAIIWVKEKIAK